MNEHIKETEVKVQQNKALKHQNHRGKTYRCPETQQPIYVEKTALSA